MTKAASVVSRLTRMSSNCRRFLFTNTDAMKRHDPYAQLGLTWGATTTEIKEAYHKKAREYHPDMNNRENNPQEAVRKFQQVQSAYQKLMGEGSHNNYNRDDVLEEWSFRVWRNGDVIAQERTDVAGLQKKRPAKPAVSLTNSSWGVAAALGHPSGRGISLKRGEYLTCSPGLQMSPTSPPKLSSTVGTGRSKWVTPKEFRPWNPQQSKQKRASRSQPSSTQTNE